MVTATLQDGQAGLPTPHSTMAYWLQNPSYVLLGRRSTPDLPPTADVIVIGSGITGAFAARELVAKGRSVLMLEAREACWGATGRNGGHCQPMIYGSKPHIAHFELETYHFLENLVEQYGIPCDWKRVGGVHALPTDELVDLTAEIIANLNAFHPQLKDCAKLFTDPESIAKFRVQPEGARGVVHQPWAAKLWPYKLVTWILEALFTNQPPEVFNLQTTTPATHLQQTEGSSRWIVHTPRGQVAANDVLLATNAYTSHLLPEMSRLVVPVRGQVAALEPPDGDVALEHSHVWLSEKSDNYLVQRNDALEMIVVGGERTNVPGGGEGIWRDDSIDEELAERLRRCLRPALKLRPSGEEEEEELRARYQWTGIMGYTTDGYPFVGKVPEELGGGRGGLWLCAGYNGHGMPVAARCAAAISEQILGQGEDERTVKLPQEFVLTADRAARVRGGELPKSILEGFTAVMREMVKGSMN